jgi:hypothetical protein
MSEKWAGTLLLAGLSALGVNTAARSEPAMSEEILAVQIRKQGYSCGKPTSALRDREHSKPNDAVWVLTCEDAIYRVRLVPKMAAEVMLQ